MIIKKYKKQKNEIRNNHFYVNKQTNKKNIFSGLISAIIV